MAGLVEVSCIPQGRNRGRLVGTSVVGRAGPNGTSMHGAIRQGNVVGERYPHVAGALVRV